MFLITDLIALLTANLILTQALGTSTLFIAADNRRSLIWTALSITLFTTAGSCAAYMTDLLLPAAAKDLTLLMYTLSVSIIYVLLLSALYFISRTTFNKAKKYIHLSAFNCAVMGTLFTATGRASADPSAFSISSYVLFGLEAGAGFVISALILTAAYRNLNSAKVPAPFRGFPAMLVYLGIISMAVYALK